MSKYIMILTAGLCFLAGCKEVIPAIVPLVIDNITVIDPESRQVRENRRVYINEEGRIAAIEAVGIEGGYRATETLDGTGKFLIPGLWNMHTHMKYFGPGYEHREPAIFLANGVTGIRILNGDCWPWQTKGVCIDQYRVLQGLVESGQVAGPHLVALASAAVRGAESRKRISSGLEDFYFHYPKTEEDGRKLARYMKARGVDFVKSYNLVPRAAYKGLMEEARTLGLEVSGHVPQAVDVATASDLGHRTIEHGRVILYDCSHYGPLYRDIMNRVANQEDGVGWPDNNTRIGQTIKTFDGALCQDIFKTLVKNGTYYVPTHLTREMDARAGEEAYRNDPRLKYISPKLYKNWRKDLDKTAAADAELVALFKKFLNHGIKITGLAHQAGVKVMVGTDAHDTMIFPGFSIHDEMAHFARAGLSGMDILRAATTVPAEYLGQLEKYGGISVNKAADLVVLDRNPLDDIGNTKSISAVILGGRVYDRAALDEMLERAAAAMKSE